MYKYTILAMLAALLATACNNNTNNETTPAKAPVDNGISKETAGSACYQGAVGRDTVWLFLSGTGNAVSGRLDYRFYEKDNNRGTLSGSMHGDTLLADYTFSSEGSTSVRQVAFLKKGDSFTEGHGAMKEQDGKTVFTNPGALDFANSFTLDKVNCNP